MVTLDHSYGHERQAPACTSSRPTVKCPAGPASSSTSIRASARSPARHRYTVHDGLGRRCSGAPVALAPEWDCEPQSSSPFVARHGSRWQRTNLSPRRQQRCCILPGLDLAGPRPSSRSAANGTTSLPGLVSSRSMDRSPPSLYRVRGPRPAISTSPVYRFESPRRRRSVRSADSSRPVRTGSSRSRPRSSASLQKRVSAAVHVHV